MDARGSHRGRGEADKAAALALLLAHFTESAKSQGFPRCFHQVDEDLMALAGAR
jgi:hypothetical protein